MNLKRSDSQYIEIENFADYELTQCISYEMAIRTKEVQNSLIKLNKYLIENNEAVTMGFFCFLDKKKELEIRNRENLENAFYSILNFCHNIPILSITDKFIDKRLGEPLLSFMEKLKHIAKEKDEDTPGLFKNKNALSILDKIGCKSCEEDKIIKRKGYSILYSVKAIARKNSDYIIPLAQQESNIELNFSRPLLQLVDQHTQDIKLMVNLNRPKDELLALIEHIKSDIDKSKLLISPMELLGLEINKADGLIRDNTGKHFNPKDTLSTQEKIADMFYVYDSYQQKLHHGDKQKIEIEISKYYQERKKKEVKFVDKTRTKYYSIAMEYIEHDRYKELITGISFP